MAEVRGKDAIIYFNIDGTFKEFGCAESISYESDTGTIETSTQGTGVTREFEYQDWGYSINISGVLMNVHTGVSGWDLHEQQRQFLKPLFRIVFTDTASNVKTITGTALITNVNMSGDQDDFASNSFTLLGSGDIDVINDVPAIFLTMEVTGTGTGAIQSIELHDPTDPGSPWIFTGPINVGTSDTWLLNGSSGAPGPGAYHISAVVTSDQAVNTFSTDAPPTGSVVVASPGATIDTSTPPFGTNTLFDFTASRTITFNLGS